MPNAFRRFSLGTLLFTLAVVGWGAYVRATGSGAGCGDHWPDCNGELIPRAPTTQTLIEYAHRLTSGLSLLLVVAVALWARRAAPRGHVVRRAAAWSVGFMVLEAALGAGLVLLKYVALDASVQRAIAMSLHLINTFLLLGAMGTTVLHAHLGDGRVALKRSGGLSALTLGAALSVLVVGVSGAIAALGDTLQQLSVRGAFVDALIALRIAHPVLAVACVVLLAFLASAVWAQRRDAHTRQAVVTLTVLVLLQLCLGLVNVALKAPVWMQLVHLLVADLVWLSLVAVGRLALDGRAASVPTPALWAPPSSPPPEVTQSPSRTA